MDKEFWTVHEVMERFEVEETFLRELEDEEILCPACEEDAQSKRFPADELEKLRLAKLLVEEMEVNLSGVDIILRMRQHMMEMRRQFDAILEDLATQLGRLER